MAKFSIIKSADEFLGEFLGTYEVDALHQTDPEIFTILCEAKSTGNLPLNAVNMLISNDKLFTYLYKNNIDIREFMCSLEMYTIKAGNLNSVAHCFFTNYDPRVVFDAVSSNIKSILEVFYG